MDIQEGMTRKTSPNDANRVVWAVGAFFFIIIRVFIILIYFYNYYSNPDRLTGDYDEENGPKRREARRLGH